MNLKCIDFLNVIKSIIVNDCFVICVGLSLLSKTVDVTLILEEIRQKLCLGVQGGWESGSKWCSNIQDLSLANIQTSVPIWKHMETIFILTTANKAKIIYKHTFKLISSLLKIFKYKVNIKTSLFRTIIFVQEN